MNPALTRLYRPRIAALRSAMSASRLDAFITTSGPSLRYLSGYAGSNGMLLVTGKKSVLLTDFRYKEIVRTTVAADRVLISQGSLTRAADDAKLFAGLKRIGFEKDRTTVAEYQIRADVIGKKRLVPTSGIVEGLRSVKDDAEIGTLKKAFAISDAVFTEILGIIRPGITELDLSAEISYRHKRYGAENDAFDVIVASGVRGSLPHGTATTKKLKQREFITLDFGCIAGGYHSDMTRTVCIGAPTADMKKVYGIVAEAQQRALDAVRAGVPAQKIDAIAREHITRSGYGKYFGHSLGHGVGLEIHELPRVAPKSSEVLTEQQVITIEPGIYLPGKFGVRIEDTIVVRTGAPDVLTGSPKGLIIL